MAPPRLAVVVVTTDDFDSVRRTVRALREQTIAGEIELILVAPTKEALGDHRPEEMGGFARVEVVPIGRIRMPDRQAASGVRRATAPLVACVENHAYPEPRWAEEIVDAHRGPWAVVGGLMVNANPRSAVSWANMFMSHLDELLPAGGESMRAFTSHNASYKRDALEAYGADLERYLGRGGNLQWDLLAKGRRLYVHLGARYYHLQVSNWAPIVPFRIAIGRQFAASRWQRGRWGLARRVAYVLGGPLIPVVHLARLTRHIRRFNQFPRVLPPLLLSLAAEAAGEMIGYAIGAGSAEEDMCEYEVRRHRYLSDGDRAALAACTDALPDLS
jgi:hypothetical protein